jgi:signal transduction histidine kinase
VLQRSIVLSAALAMLLFATPLAVAVDGLYRNQALSDLARDAEKLRTSLSDRTSGSVNADPSDLVIPQPDDTELGVYTVDGVLVAGRGPAMGERIVRQVGGQGVEADGVQTGRLLVVVPVPHDDRGGYVVRAARPYSDVRTRTYATWILMLGLAVVVLVLVTGLARTRARRIARPLQQLAGWADALGHGDFSVRATRAGVAEVDHVSENLERTARRLGAMLERERSFSADASHQLRTPLTAVRIGLESALLTPGADLRGAAEEALDGLDRLEQTVLDLLALARDTTGPESSADVAALTREAVGHWTVMLRDAGRSLDLFQESSLPAVAVSAPALRTVLDVLLGNALTHGGGPVRVQVRDTGEIVVVEVSDQGNGITANPEQIFRRRSAEARGTGIGLALARSLIEADGGRLELTNVRPATFALLLPVERPSLDDVMHGAEVSPRFADAEPDEVRHGDVRSGEDDVWFGAPDDVGHASADLPSGRGSGHWSGAS